MVKPVNKKPTTETIGTQFKGVRKRKWGKWVSEIRLPNSRERIWLGSYDTAEKAARAFDAATFCLRGHFAKFNFPDDPPEIACGKSLTPSEIQVAAARFANSEPLKIRSEQSKPASGTDDSASPPVSDGTVRFKDYEIFPGFDDLMGDVIGSSEPIIGGEEDDSDGILVSESLLWNF
ncbi:hypothetical protein GQ457_08G003620 [Hibiscus cannabinus]